MKIRAPFEIQRVTNTDPAQAVHTKWYVAGLVLDRLRVFSKYPATKLATQWRYVRQNYLGAMMLSIPSHKYVWRMN